MTVSGPGRFVKPARPFAAPDCRPQNLSLNLCLQAVAG